MVISAVTFELYGKIRYNNSSKTNYIETKTDT